MDPNFKSVADKSGVQSIRDGRVQLYYEIRGMGNAEKVVCLNGAFATLKHYEQMADAIAKTGRYEVLTFDYRGMGKSKVDRTIKFGAKGKETEPRSQTSEMLAEDTVQLINAVWGSDARVHVYGASMGGFISEKLALLLIPEHRLLSMYLGVTARGQAPRMPFLGAGFYKMMMPMLVKKNKEDMVKSLLPQCFGAEYLDATTTLPDGKAIKNRDLWFERWTTEYGDWYGFVDTEACACQCTVVGKHWLTDEEAAKIKASGVPVFVHIALGDMLMKPKDQQELARILGAQKKEFPGGHMGNPDGYAQFIKGVISFYDESVQRREH